MSVLEGSLQLICRWAKKRLASRGPVACDSDKGTGAACEQLQRGKTLLFRFFFFLHFLTFLFRNHLKLTWKLQKVVMA